MTDIDKYIIARWAYSVGEPIMDDASYNALDRAMHAQYPDMPACKRSWSSDPCPAALLRKYRYDHLIKHVIMSDKTESIPSINTLVEVQSEYSYMTKPHMLSFKLDGWNIQASYYMGQLVHIQTRGRSTDAMDANALRGLIPKTIPNKGKCLVTMELVVPNEDFKWFKENCSSTSQRGACSTAIARGGDALKHVKLLAHGVRCNENIPNTELFNTLEKWGFDTPTHCMVESYEQLMDSIDAFTNRKDSYEYPTDGLVCTGPDKVRAIRIKGWEEPVYRSYVTGYEESYGPHSIAIQLRIFPIRLQNSVQTVLPATNISRVMSLKLVPGAPVAFRIASASIADIDEDVTRSTQKEYENRFAEYRFMVEMNESLK